MRIGAYIHWNTAPDGLSDQPGCEWNTGEGIDGTPYLTIRIGTNLDIFCTPAQALKLREVINDCPELREWEEAQREPECTCVAIDVDQVDARGCDAHGPHSLAARERREREAAEEVAFYAGTPSEPNF